MNCHDALSLITAERDGPLAAESRSALEVHVASCPACRQSRADLARTIEYWRAGVAGFPAPDPQHEWLALRRRIRGGTEAGVTVAAPRRRPLLAWLAMPLAAALVAAFFVLSQPTPEEIPGPARPNVARADSVEVSGASVSTMVFVDDKSGWLIVWASDAGGKRS